jgi:hypothetical protein
MYFTTILRLCNNGIWQDKQYLNGDYPDGKFPPSSTFIKYDNIGSVGDDIRNNTTLKALVLYGGDLTDHTEARTRHFQLLCDGINGNLSIKEIVFLGLHSSGMDFCRLLTPLFVRNNNILQEITLSHCELSEEEHHTLATALACRETPLDTLHYQSNTIIKLATAFYENPELFPKKLNAELSTNFIGEAECKSIQRILQAPECTMEELTIKTTVPMSRRMTTEVAIFFANALVENKSLNKLDIGGFYATKDVYKAFTKMVCNKLSINSTYTSNHTLVTIKDIHVHIGQVDNQIAMMQYFIMNINSDKKSVARQKVLMHHFSGQFSMNEFEQMGPDLLMRSLIFLDKWGSVNDRASYDVARQSILFQLLKSNPMIVVPQIKVVHDTEISRPSKRIRSNDGHTPGSIVLKLYAFVSLNINIS